MAGHAPLAFQLRRRGNELVHAAIALRHGQNVLDAAEQVVGIQHRVLGDAPQSVRAVRANVAVHPHQHARVAEESSDAADRLGPVVVQGSSRSPSCARRPALAGTGPASRSRRSARPPVRRRRAGR